ncbi:MAG: AAA family ATPase [Chloroflexota bacterium]
MAEVIAVANQKGGVGKTTSTLSLGAALKELGNRVLLVDLDPQGSLTLAMGIDPETLDRTIYTALRDIADQEEASVSDLNIIQGTEGIDLVPTNIELSQADIDLVREPLGIFALRDIIQTVDDYDYILIDCPPSLGILTTNALAAANQVIIPLQADYLALKGVNLLLRTITKIQRRANRELKVGGVFLTMADTRTLHTKEMIDTTHRALDGRVPVFKSMIKMSVYLKEAPVSGQSILTYASDTNSAASYRQLAQEMLAL